VISLVFAFAAIGAGWKWLKVSAQPQPQHVAGWSWDAPLNL
jgi:hypothetical protein